ncbi:MAG: M20 family metallopeptidase [Anaerolineae bacterium]|nr:M20 family metallopeptidase [Anaerolineae bacterium]
MSELLTFFQGRRGDMVELLKTLVSYETPTRDKASVDKMGAFMEARFNELGASSVTRIPQTEVGDLLLAKWNEGAPGKPIMFLIHIDTVWPLGTLAERPTYIDDQDRLFGPGAIDMKGGITIVLETLRGLKDRGEMPDRPIWVLMTSDEEVGSVYSNATIKAESPKVGLVLVMEPATIDEALKTMRKGVATYRLDIEGLPSHAGNQPEKGVNAIIEFANQALIINRMNDLKNGRSVSVTMVEGGSATNVIPAHVTAFVDTRAISVQQFEETEGMLLELQAVVPGAKLKIERINGHTPMERNDAMVGNYQQAKRLGEAQGLTITEASSGGGSDGNTVASLGVAVLDGLGPQGDGLHALHEHVVLNSMPRRCTLIAAMLKDWVFEEE